MKIQLLLSEGGSTASPLYRGIKRKVPFGETTSISVRTDRKPRHLSPLTTLMFNYAFEKEFGIRNVRNSCVFATTSIATAEQYADGGAVLQLALPPDATVLYHPGVTDSIVFEYSVTEAVYTFLDETLRDLVNSAPAESELIEQGRRLMNLRKDPKQLQPFMDKHRSPIKAWVAYLTEIATICDTESIVSRGKVVFEAAASTITPRYESVHADMFVAPTVSQPGQGIEVIIPNLSEYRGMSIDPNQP